MYTTYHVQGAENAEHSKILVHDTVAHYNYVQYNRMQKCRIQ